MSLSSRVLEYRDKSTAPIFTKDGMLLLKANITSALILENPYRYSISTGVYVKDVGKGVIPVVMMRKSYSTLTVVNPLQTIDTCGEIVPVVSVYDPWMVGTVKIEPGVYLFELAFLKLEVDFRTIFTGMTR